MSYNFQREYILGSTKQIKDYTYYISISEAMVEISQISYILLKMFVFWSFKGFECLLINFYCTQINWILHNHCRRKRGHTLMVISLLLKLDLYLKNGGTEKWYESTVHKLLNTYSQVIFFPIYYQKNTLNYKSNCLIWT